MSSPFIISQETPVYAVECQGAFEGLTEREKRYAHHLAQASFMASPAVLFQTSPESPSLFALLLRFFARPPPGPLPRSLLVFASHFFSNMGNYKSFGDSKFVPELPAEELEALLRLSPAWEEHLQPLWSAVKDPLYSLGEREQQLGFGPAHGISTYYTLDVLKEEAEQVQRFMDHLSLSPYNTRLFKRGEGRFELRLASSRTGAGEDPVSPLLKEHSFEGLSITLTRGDYAPFMAMAVEHLGKAREHAANDNQRAMLERYIESFETGSIDAHKEGSRSWIKDQGPVVESYIGFIESYRDPLGVRGEWEGFVAMVNKEVSLKYSKLVSQAQDFLPRLPWPKEFEKDQFLRPDFTSLEVLAFAGSGIPAGINIPNYDDIRQSEGFKNVSLGNILAARSGKEPVTFLGPADQERYQNLQAKAFEVQVAIHELLGHGSGKLFHRDASGALDYPASLLNPLDNSPISSCYAPGQTYDSVFADLGSSYEECRAESVGIYLCLDRELLKIFGYEDSKDADEIIYINWLIMVRAGFLGLEYYTPSTKAWRQAHMQARFVILRVLLEAGEGLVQIERTELDGKPYANIKLDASKIDTVGKKAIGNFLLKLQVYKATGDIEKARKLYAHYSSAEGEWEELRNVVMLHKKPRPVYVQPITEEDPETGKIVYRKYNTTHEDLIASSVKRFAHLVDKVLETPLF